MDTNWVEIEYEALRQEILVLIEAQQSAVRFFLPAAAAILCHSLPYESNISGSPLDHLRGRSCAHDHGHELHAPLVRPRYS